MLNRSHTAKPTTARATTLITAALMSLTAGVSADVLFDNGVRDVSGSTIAPFHPVNLLPDGSGTATFQRFTVGDAAGWSLDSISYLGRNGLNPEPDSNAIMLASLYAWTGSVGTLGPAIGAAIIEFANTGQVIGDPVWIVGDYSGIELAQGEYVIGARGLDAFSDVAWSHALIGDDAIGPTAIGLNLVSGDTVVRGAAATLLIEGTVLPAPATIPLFAGMGLLAGRRRR